MTSSLCHTFLKSPSSCGHGKLFHAAIDVARVTYFGIPNSDGDATFYQNVKIKCFTPIEHGKYLSKHMFPWHRMHQGVSSVTSLSSWCTRVVHTRQMFHVSNGGQGHKKQQLSFGSLLYLIDILL